MRRSRTLLIATLLAPAAAAAQQVDLGASRIVDLTHPFNAETVYWPTAASTFELRQDAHGHTEGGWFYSANSFDSPEHGGTHLDAPIHFAEGGLTAEQIPLKRLVGPAVVIDVSAAAEANPDYRLTRADVLAFEEAHGRIAEGTIVLLRTGWSRRWPDRRRYLGDDTPGDASRLHFPSFGEDAARLLVEERRVAAIGAPLATATPSRNRNRNRGGSMEERERKQQPTREDDDLRGGPVRERQRADGGQITQREAFEEPGQAGREDALNASRSGGTENRPGDRSDPMPPEGGSSR